MCRYVYKIMKLLLVLGQNSCSYSWLLPLGSTIDSIDYGTARPLVSMVVPKPRPKQPGPRIKSSVTY